MNTVSWTAWLLLAMVYCAFTYNPIYQLLLFAALSSVVLSMKQDLKGYVKIGLLVSFIPLFVNTFLVHAGKTVLYTIPFRIDILGLMIPTTVFSGPITLESTLTGLVMTVFLINMITAFQLFNNVTSPDAIIRLIPSTMPSIALASSIAFRFMPTISKDYERIRDAQISRGLKTETGSSAQKVRNSLGIIVPSTITALERGFSLAESMASRGYSGKRTIYRVDNWRLKDKIGFFLYCLALVIVFYAKLSGVFDFWPYDGINIGPLSPYAILPLIVITSPVFLKHESC